MASGEKPKENGQRQGEEDGKKPYKVGHGEGKKH